MNRFTAGSRPPGASRKLRARADNSTCAPGLATCLLLGLSLATAPEWLAGRAAAAAPDGSEFLPGDVWHDTAGSPINAHAGGMLLHQGVYYWYGEVRCGVTTLPDSNRSWGGTRVKLAGVSCYSSTNLYAWHNEGLALSAVPDKPQHDLHPSRVLERPKVIYNRRTRQFVMWMHLDSADYAEARVGVAVSAGPTGPFHYQGSFRPNAGVWPSNATAQDKQPGPANALARDFHRGQMARDLALFVDDDDNAYLFYASEDNATMHVSRLTDDYLRTADEYTRILVGRSVEAPAVFKSGSQYYLIGSGCTAWAPNAARSAVAPQALGPWTELGNPCVGQDADKTFHAQSTFVLPVAGLPGSFIFMADRWEQWDLANSRYVWLPLEVGPDGKPVVRWRDRWSLSEKGKGASH
ncbi:MAG TPA: glycoside hydrolase family 43 protein [Candidatus Acidoferrum sp.]|nr:glycoside hydrolase family 43 protein [Candidatus Acidoferrum sp.]